MSTRLLKQTLSALAKPQTPEVAHSADKKKNKKSTTKQSRITQRRKERLLKLSQDAGKLHAAKRATKQYYASSAALSNDQGVRVMAKLLGVQPTQAPAADSDEDWNW